MRRWAGCTLWLCMQIEVQLGTKRREDFLAEHVRPDRDRDSAGPHVICEEVPSPLRAKLHLGTHYLSANPTHRCMLLLVQVSVCHCEARLADGDVHYRC